MSTASRIDQKARIRREAARLFAKNGYEATGIQELCDTVGLGRGALYHHIGSKQKLLFDIVSVPLIGLVEGGEALLAEPLGAEEKVRRLSAMIITTVVDDLPAWTIFNHDYRSLKGPVRKEVIVWRERFERIWVNIIDQGVHDGEFRELDRVALMGLLGAHNHASVWIRPRGRLSADEIADVFCDLMLNGLKR